MTDDLRKRLEAAELDAKRYRWLLSDAAEAANIFEAADAYSATIQELEDEIVKRMAAQEQKRD